MANVGYTRQGRQILIMFITRRPMAVKSCMQTFLGQQIGFEEGSAACIILIDSIQ